MIRHVRNALPFAAFIACVACVGKNYVPPTFEKTLQKSGTTSRLQAVSAANADVVWASGLEGTVLRTTDGGTHWTTLVVPDASNLQFRDVHAFDDQSATILSAGDGPASRIYRTDNGGESWSLQYTVREPGGFLDCLDFWDRDRGIAYGDSVEGKLYILRTMNGGATWSRVIDSALPKAGTGEGGFAASGGCVHVASGGRAWIATGGGGNARVLRSDDWGASWRASETPHQRGEAAGIMSVVRDDNALLAFGGDLQKPDTASRRRVAASNDRGKTWNVRASPRFPGAIYGAAVGGEQEHAILIAHGPGGMAISHDGGRSWRPLDPGDYWAIAFGADLRFWAVGPMGSIVRFDANAR